MTKPNLPTTPTISANDYRMACALLSTISACAGSRMVAYWATCGGVAESLR